MKNLTLLFALLFSIPLTAQISYEVHAGPSLSWVSIDGISDQVLPQRNPIVSYQAGLNFRMPLHSHFDFITGADYTQRGFQTEVEHQVDLFNLNLPVGAEAITRMDYLSLPVKFEYHTNQEKVNFFVNAGPRAAMALDGQIRTRARLLLEFNTGTYDLDPGGNLLERFEIGGEIGTGIRWDMPRGEMLFGLDYYHSFTNALRDPIIHIDFRNRSLLARLGYNLRF